VEWSNVTIPSVKTQRDDASTTSQSQGSGHHVAFHECLGELPHVCSFHSNAIDIPPEIQNVMHEYRSPLHRCHYAMIDGANAKLSGVLAIPTQ